MRNLARYLALSRVGALRAILRKRLLQCAIDAFEATSERTIATLLAELSTSTTPKRTVMLVSVLKKLVVAAPEKFTDKSPFLSNLPGSTPLERLLLCQRVLHSCFAMHLFREELAFEVHPIEDFKLRARASKCQSSLLTLPALAGNGAPCRASCASSFLGWFISR